MKVSGSDSQSTAWFRSVNCDAGYGIALLGAAALILGLTATGQGGVQALRYERAGLLAHQWWRLLSAHVMHLGWWHALLNVLALVLLWLLFARAFSPRRWLWILVLSVAMIDAGLWFLRPAVQWYLGASGVLHGVLAAGACAMYRRGEEMGALLLLLLVVKLLYEQRFGGSLFLHDLPLVPDAHLFGVLGGLVGAFLPRAAARPVPMQL
ncbi:MAG TPA: rhombosortase [Steroidobacteraceae bacterium]|jgi:rhomboid family GlyGly-CTERM serine protease|nr:rhombosortase [Steroidobacteraceae bacterium]